MIRSMTAFSRREKQGPWGSLTLELRSVNHRYLESMLRLPEELRSLDPMLRERIAQRLNRGKVECQLRYQAPQADADSLVIDEGLAQTVIKATRTLDSMIYNPAPINAMDILRWPGVVQTPQADQEALKAALAQLLDEALDELLEGREREGEKLQGMIRQRCDAMQEVVIAVRERLPQILDQQRQRLRDKVAEMGAELEAERLEQEIVILAQKIDVDEEMDRLATHIEEVRRVLGQDKPVGRRLDFLMQELNREANTLGSKSVDTETTRASVELKVLIEQMREQIQNIE